MTFIEDVSRELNIEINNHSLFEQAFIHKSLAKSGELIDHNERLEYLGDAVVGLVVADILYRLFPSDDEGSLSRKRASLVNESTLSRISNHFKLTRFLKVHSSQSLAELQSNPRISASLFEAVVGALFIDLGFEKTSLWVEHVFKNIVHISFEEHDFTNDFKTRFQELIQSKSKITPTYETIETAGPDHLRMFTVTVSVDGQVRGQGQGLSKKLAAQEAARNALEKEDQDV